MIHGREGGVCQSGRVPSGPILCRKRKQDPKPKDLRGGWCEKTKKKGTTPRLGREPGRKASKWGGKGKKHNRSGEKRRWKKI